jgi:Domain of unknown function (DUF5753)
MSAEAEPTVPGCEDQPWLADGQGAGEMDGVGAAQGVAGGELPGVLLDGTGELDWPGGGPVLFPCLLGGGPVGRVEVVIAPGGGERGPDLGVGEAAGDGGVTATQIRSWQPMVIDGLLQTPEYARALLAVQPNTTEDELEERVATRLSRQMILDRPDPPLLWVLMDEAALIR